MSNMNKVELLAPAGDYQAFLGAICAGADAVYLGGPKFGARAYAKNLTEEEICSAVCYAHLFDKKVYLTVNTLVKQAEFEQLYAYLAPFYECGLDGVIVQDMGVAAYVKRQFPSLALHISTQAAVTGRYGARLMKEVGAVRIVPARELSLQEIKEIKQDTGLEIETFVHGAICYCYSGQCLFSSTLGGRSGNRGRCAQPCRLPYDGSWQRQEAEDTFHSNNARKQPEKYPLSMKDMCTIQLLPKLIEAGIDSFKIEGRMKKPEYAAGVTAIYRKYIDRYYETPDKPFRVEDGDIDQLSQLYVRSGLQDGYYTKHNGREMIALTQPGYDGSNETLLEEIRKRYLEKPIRLPVSMWLYLAGGEPAKLTASAENTEITVSGETAQPAKSRPLTEDEIQKQLQKTGETPFICRNIKIISKGEVFLPVRALNALRRQALEGLYQKLREPYQRTCEKEQPVCKERMICEEQPKGQITDSLLLAAEVQNEAQALAALQIPGLYRLYVPADIICFKEWKHSQKAMLSSGNTLENILENPFLSKGSPLSERLRTYWQENADFQLYVTLPHIFRMRSEKLMEETFQTIYEFQTDHELPGSFESPVDGFLVRNLEEIAWLKEKGYDGAVQADAGIYVWNREAEAFFQSYLKKVQTTLPYELSGKELAQLAEPGQELIVYGRTPLMLSANCVRQTLAQCTQSEDFFWLRDRYRKQFPVRIDCRHCYNIIYNSIPTSLHNYLKEIRKWRCALRVVFTTESGAETKAVLQMFRTLADGKKWERDLPIDEYTSGYYKRGVE